MGLLDIDKNINNIPLNFILQFLPKEVECAFIYQRGLWMFENQNSNSLMYITEFELEDNFNSIWYIWKELKENYDNIQIDPNNPIPRQLEEVFKNYLNDQNITIKTDELFIRYDCRTFMYTQTDYERYLIRHNLGQNGFEHSPERIGYLHTIFIISDEKIHWFLPLRLMTEKG